MPDIYKSYNGANSSLNTGLLRLNPGDRIRIIGDNRILEVTYVMSDKDGFWWAAFNHQGAMPIGDIAFEIISQVS